MTYLLQGTKKQLRVISKSCDIYARALMGQVDILFDLLPIKKDADYTLVNRVKNILRELLPTILTQGVNGFGSSLGVSSPELDEDGRIAVDVYHVVRHHLAWEQAIADGLVKSTTDQRKLPEMIYVDYDKPFHWGEEPLVEVTTNVIHCVVQQFSLEDGCTGEDIETLKLFTSKKKAMAYKEELEAADPTCTLQYLTLPVA